jgi:hypothetical protein
VTSEEMAIKSEMLTVQSLNSIDGFHTTLKGDFTQNASILFLMSVMHYLNSAMLFSTSALDRQYGFSRLLVSLISLSIIATASPVASPAFNDSPLTSF